MLTKEKINKIAKPFLEATEKSMGFIGSKEALKNLIDESNENYIRIKVFYGCGRPAYEIYPSFPLKPYLEEIAKLLKEYNMETENNTKRGGLKPEFLEILKANDVSIHLSSDAHRYYEIGRDFPNYIDSLKK